MALKASAWSSSSSTRLRGSGVHAVEIEIGDPLRLAGDRLHRARQALAKQDRGDDRADHREQARGLRKAMRASISSPIWLC